MLAIGALRSVAAQGLRVPGDIAVVDFDNADESAFSVPALTTVAPDKAALADTAIDLVCRRITGETPVPPQHVLTPFALEIRERTRGG